MESLNRFWNGGMLKLAAIGLALAMLNGCSSGNSDSVAEALADRLTDSLGFEGGTVKEGTPPPGKSGPSAPQIDQLQGSGLRLNAPFSFALNSSFTAPENVDKTIVAVRGATKYIEVKGALVAGLMDLVGKLKSDDALRGQGFQLEFALQTSDGITGLYRTIGAKVSNDPPQAASSGGGQAIQTVTADGETHHESGRPAGEPGSGVPQIGRVEGPGQLLPGGSFTVALTTAFTGGVTAALLTTPGNAAYKEIPAGAADGTVTIRGTLSSQGLAAGDRLVFQWALKASGGVGLYRSWNVEVVSELPPADGDGEAVVEADETLPEGESGEKELIEIVEEGAEEPAEEEQKEIEVVDTDSADEQSADDVEGAEETVQEEGEPELEPELESEPELEPDPDPEPETDIPTETDPEPGDLADPDILAEDEEETEAELEADEGEVEVSLFFETFTHSNTATGGDQACYSCSNGKTGTTSLAEGSTSYFYSAPGSIRLYAYGVNGGDVCTNNYYTCRDSTAAFAQFNTVPSFVTFWMYAGSIPPDNRYWEKINFFACDATGCDGGTSVVANWCDTSGCSNSLYNDVPAFSVPTPNCEEQATGGDEHTWCRQTIAWPAAKNTPPYFFKIQAWGQRWDQGGQDSWIEVFLDNICLSNAAGVCQSVEFYTPGG